MIPLHYCTPPVRTRITCTLVYHSEVKTAPLLTGTLFYLTMLSLLSWESFVIHDGSESFWGTGTGPGEKQGLVFQLSDDWVTRIMRVVPKLRWLVAGFEPRSGHVGFVVNKVELGQVFSEYLGLLCQVSFHWLLHIHHLSSGAGAMGQLVAEVPNVLRLTPPEET
jgi:hypothetical protein